MRGDYMAVCIYQFPLFISDKNKREVSDQTFNHPHIRSDLEQAPIDFTYQRARAELVPDTQSCDCQEIYPVQN